MFTMTGINQQILRGPDKTITDHRPNAASIRMIADSFQSKRVDTKQPLNIFHIGNLLTIKLCHHLCYNQS